MISPTQWRVYVASAEPGNLMQLAARTVLAEVEVIESLQYPDELRFVPARDVR